MMIIDGFNAGNYVMYIPGSIKILDRYNWKTVIYALNQTTRSNLLHNLEL